MSTIGANEYACVAWHNRATRFYLAARRLYHSDLLAPAAYCAAMSLDLIFKVTLIYWDKSVDPETAAHAMAKLARMVGNKVPKAKGLNVPNYFYYEQRYLTVPAQHHLSFRGPDPSAAETRRLAQLLRADGVASARTGLVELGRWTGH
jgi:hypothetical protein